MLPKLNRFLREHFELLLVVSLLVVISAVFHWIPAKLAFLNFFYLPVLAAGYLLGARRAILSALLTVLLIVLYYFYFWTEGALRANLGFHQLRSIIEENWVVVIHLAMWGGFLILSGGLLGRLHERMTASFNQVNELNSLLERQAEELRRLNTALEATAAELKKQAEELQERNVIIEELKQKVEKTLFSTMDPTVARLIMQGRLRQEKRGISVLFCDLKGFTHYAQGRHPEVVLEELNRFYQAMEEIIEIYHGHIDKYLGDGIVCEFGAPVDYEQHSLQAVVCAMKMQERFKELNSPWQMRIGVASGDSLVGLLGCRRRSYSAIGQVVNVAKRLEELCEPGCVYMDEALYQAVQPLLEVRQVHSLAGRRTDDRMTLGAITEKEQQLARDPQNADLIFYLGLLYFRVHEASKAMDYLRRAMELRPEDTEIKVAYADASLKKDEYEKISFRGVEGARAVFEAVGLVNPLLDRRRFPQNFYDRFGFVQEMLEIPDNVVLPTEVIDASVGHSLAVAAVSYAVAERLGLPEDVRRDLVTAARLQDMGKSVIWHHVLNRRGGLSDEERKELEAHVAQSLAMAKRAGYDRPGMLEVIANHHELMNGAGYPGRIKGDQIPIGARISGVADVYCALTSWRPYREAWDSRIALSEMRKGAESGRYDPKVVEALQEVTR